jgi:hypothetical protein
MLQTKYQISDANYADNIKCDPLHYNSMRAKPINPIALIENNITSSKPFPNTWATTKDEWLHFRDATQFRKRCLFDFDEKNTQIHLRSIDSISNRHLLEENIKFPEEDYIYQVLGQKKLLDNSSKRNYLPELSPGDKTYKTPEFSKDFFHKKTANWRSQRWEKKKKNKFDEDYSPNELMALLNLDSTASLLSNKYDFGYEQNFKQEKEEEISNVKELDNWQQAPGLELPFKVLDQDKNIKYRPKVSRF